MLRKLICLIVLSLVGARALQALNPQDIEFRARLMKSAHVYHMGEPIEIEISYSSQAAEKYYGEFIAPNPRLGTVIPHVTPMDGVLELRRLWTKQGMTGSVTGRPAYVGLQPHTQQLDLGGWYRIQKPGHYSVVVTSIEVARVETAQEGGGLYYFTLESNPVEFEILPDDPAWDAAQFTRIRQELNAATTVGQRQRALRRLSELDSPASARLLVKLYLASTDSQESQNLASDLEESAHVDVIIPLLGEALSDPASQIPRGLTSLLAGLQTRRQLGVQALFPPDPADEEKWSKEDKVRSVVYSTYLSMADARLSASIEKRSGASRADALFQVWHDATELKAAAHFTPANLAQLESDVLAVTGRLDPERQTEFAELTWDSMEHEKLHPLIRELAEGSVSRPPRYGNTEAFQLWCEGWPDECNAAILQDIQRTHAKMNQRVVAMLTEAEHPELDGMLEAQLKEPALLENPAQSKRTAAAVLRAGSRQLVPTVDSFLDRMAASDRCNGITEGELFGYLLRVQPKDGKRRLAALLEDKSSPCGTEALRVLHELRPSKDILSIATKALNSPNLRSEQAAALYLADHGRRASEKVLWRRLDQLWNKWRAHAAELRNLMPGKFHGIRYQTAVLEQALASALIHGKNWKISGSERKQLLAGCLTKGCKKAAEGEGYLSL